MYAPNGNAVGVAAPHGAIATTNRLNGNDSLHDDLSQSEQWIDIARDITSWGGDRTPAYRTMKAALPSMSPEALNDLHETLTVNGILSEESLSFFTRRVFRKHGIPLGALAEVPPSPDLVSAVAQDPILSVIATQAPTEDNLALIAARVMGGTVKYAVDRGRFFVWDGRRWKADDLGKVLHSIRELTRQANREGKASVASSRFTQGVERFIKSDPSITVRGTDFDSNNYMLNTPAGTIDLRNNVLHQHNPSTLISKMCAVSPSNDGADLFLKFLDEVTGGDRELALFLQVSLGACLSGALEAHWLIFWTGAGRNGKNTLGDVVMYVMGDYAVKIAASILMAKKHEGHPTELAQLQGTRLAVSSEVATGEHWNEALIKELTGDAVISARFMRQDFFQFPRTHKHLVFGNNRPQIRSVDPAIKSRLHIVPFKQSFLGREDMTLPDRLRDEAGGYILQWLIEGHAKWLELGRRLPECAAVKAEADEYFAAQSTIEAWIDERCKVNQDDHRPASYYPTATDLYADYAGWKQRRGEHPLSQTVWGEQMTQKFKKVKSNGVRYIGIDALEPLGTPFRLKRSGNDF